VPRIRIRPLCEQDTDGIISVYERAGAVDPEIGPIPRVAWQRFVKMLQNQNGRDFRVAERDGRIVGIAESSLRDQGSRKVRFLKIVVDPAARRQGIASTLLTELLAIDESSDNLLLQSLCSPSWPSGLAFLKALGFAHIESELTLRCLRLIAPTVTTPTVLSIYQIAKPEDQAADVARIHNDAYRSDVAFRHYSPEEMVHVLKDGDVWLAAVGGHTVGFCHLECEPEIVWLESIAIDPTYQRRGLGRLLAYQALKAADICPARPAELNVSSVNRAAIQLYGLLGFEPNRERCRYAASHGQVAALLAHRHRTANGA
jgi:ribosomal protein S18 acetylase RimI-like enzyme